MRVSKFAVVALFVIALSVFAAPVQAQTTEERPVTFGALGGLNISNMSSPDTGPESPWPGDSLTNFMAGGFVQVRATANLALRIEGIYSGKGTKGSVIDESGTPIILTDRLHYLAIPVLARVSFGPISEEKIVPYVVVGPEFGVKLRATQTVDFGGLGQNTNSQSISSSIKSTDVGIAFGGGVDFRPFMVELRYTLGLVNVAETGLPEAKNRVLSVLVGLRF